MNGLQQDGLTFVLLSPTVHPPSAPWKAPRESKSLHDFLLRSVQQFRGRIYLNDGAIQEWQLDNHGAFPMWGDERSWHLILLSGKDRVVGCARYLVHPNTVGFEQLVLKHAELSRDKRWGKKMRYAFETEIRIARSEGVPYVEIGGWAIDEEFRNTRAALRTLLASYAWGRLIGGCRSACTATVRHGSSSILRKIGGTPLEYFGEELPSYHDPLYSCEMELLRFDWRSPSPRFLPLVEDIESELRGSAVISAGARRTVARNPSTRNPSKGFLVA